MLLWYLIVFEITSILAVDLKHKQTHGQGHAPFSDVHEHFATADLSHKIFSEEELSSFNGQNPDFPIYVAVKGVVFDVSEAKDIYGPGERYYPLAGIDGSRAIAKMSLTSDNLNGNLDDLSNEEFNRLEDKFHNVYMAKYPVAGYLKGHEPKLEDDNLTWRKEDL